MRKTPKKRWTGIWWTPTTNSLSTMSSRVSSNMIGSERGLSLGSQPYKLWIGAQIIIFNQKLSEMSTKLYCCVNIWKSLMIFHIFSYLIFWFDFRAKREAEKRKANDYLPTNWLKNSNKNFSWFMHKKKCLKSRHRFRSEGEQRDTQISAWFAHRVSEGRHFPAGNFEFRHTVRVSGG